MEINRINQVSMGNISGIKPVNTTSAKKADQPGDWMAVNPDSFSPGPVLGNVISSMGGKENVEVEVKTVDARDADFLFQARFEPEEVWSFEGSRRQIDGKPLVDKDGSLFFGSNDYKAFHIDKDGKELWSKNLGGDIYAGPVKNTDGNILFAAGNDLYAMTPGGKEAWRFDTDGSLTNSPVLAKDGTIYLPSCDNKMYALKPDGTKKWEFECEGTPHPPLLDDKGNLYFGDVKKGFHSLDKDGNVRWTRELPDDMWETPAMGKDGKIYGGLSDGNVYCFDPATGKDEWNVKTNWTIDSSPLITNRGEVVVGNQDGKLYCIDTKEKKLKWKFDPDGFEMKFPVQNNMDNIYAIGKEHIYCVSPDGLPLWKKEMKDGVNTPLAFSPDNKTMYVGMSDGSLKALKRKDTFELPKDLSGPDGKKIEEEDGWVIIGGVRVRKRKNH